MWANLCGGTANLKFRQFNPAVCDTFGVVWGFEAIWSLSLGICGCIPCFGVVRVVGQLVFDVWYAEFCGWGLFVCMLGGAGRKKCISCTCKLLYAYGYND